MSTVFHARALRHWVNGNTATRRGEYYHYALNVPNSTAQYQTVTVVSQYGAGQTESGKAYVPPATESFIHDADGNFTSDGRWTYTWDGENRLVQMIRDTDTPSGARQKLVFEYDWQGRRIRKQFYTYSGGWVEQTDTICLYYDWSLMGELNANASNAKVRTYVWGTDLSGSMTGAGGVGGLLFVTYHSSPVTRHFVAFDGNGNVGALTDAANGSLSARYDYGPFGESVRATGPMSDLNPVRFSTKYTDPESGLLYYGYRYYNPSTGRWLNRDSIEERGGQNLYGTVGNYPVGEIDLMGLLTAAVQSIDYHGHGSAEKNGTFWQYVEVDSSIRGQVPLNVTDAKPAAAVRATLDESFGARIVAWTALSRDSSISALQMSTDLSGTIKVCCPCPFKKVRATWSARAAVTGTAGNAIAQFDSGRPAITSWNRPSASRSGVIDKTLATSYCSTFAFTIGQGWTDVSKSIPTTSTVRVAATFECFD